MDDFIFKKLPTDIINYILEYTGKIYYHKGKYISKLDISKYTILCKIQKPIKLPNNAYNLYLFNSINKNGYILRYILGSDNVIRLSVLYCRGIHYTSSEYFIIPKTSPKWKRVQSYEGFTQI